MAASEKLEIELIRDDRSLQALAPDWHLLYDAAGRHNPFLSWGWTMACRAHVRPGAEPFVLAAWDEGGRLVGIAPLCLERAFGMRVLRFLADGRSDYLGFLAHPDVPGAERRLLEQLAELRRAWDVAVLRHLTPDYSTLSASATPPGLVPREINGEVSAQLDFPGDWEELARDGPRAVRHSKRWARRFEKRGGQVVRLAGPEALARVDDVSRVEARSWKGRGGTARFQPGPGRDLLRSALESTAAETMEVWLALVEGRPIAFQINFLAPGRLLYYQGAYDEEHRSHYAGGVLHRHALAQAWAEGRREYDFMAGDEAYKADWTNGVRTLRYLAVHPRTVRGRAAYGLLVAPRWRLKRSEKARSALARWARLRGRGTVGPRNTSAKASR